LTDQETRAVEYGPVEILLIEDNPADVRLTSDVAASDFCPALVEQGF